MTASVQRRVDRPRLRWLGGLLPPLVLSAWAYWPITANYFHVDDFQHLYLIADGRLAEFLVTPHGGHMLVARNALFALTHALFGVDPRGYFGLVLLTHLVNVGLVYAVIAEITGRRALACAGAALWGASPLNAAALGWYSVYGQVALTTIVLALVWRLARAARSGEPLTRRATVGWWLLAIAGSTCFGTGIGIALGLAVVVPWWLTGAGHRFTRRVFASLLLVVPLLYLLVQGLFRVAAAGEVHASAAAPDLALAKLPAMAAMALQMVPFGVARTLTGWWWPAAPYPSAGLLSAVALCAAVVAVGAWRAAPAPRRAIVACLLLAAGAYAIVGVGRWYMIGFDRVPRYHYLPPALLVIAGCAALAGLLRSPPRAVGTTALVVWIALLAAGLHRAPAIDHHDAERATVADFRAAVLDAARQAAPGATAYVANRPMRPINAFARLNTFPGWAALYVIYFPDDTVDGRRVAFVVHNPALVRAARQRVGTRTATLLVTPADAAASPGAAPPAAAPATPPSAPGGGSNRGATR